MFVSHSFPVFHPCLFNPAAHHQIERTLFEDTVKTLNNYYAEAEKIGGQSYLEGCLACATAYLVFLCMETRYEKVRLVILFHFNRLGR